MPIFLKRINRLIFLVNRTKSVTFAKILLMPPLFYFIERYYFKRLL